MTQFFTRWCSALSGPASLRALRAVLTVPVLFAICDRGIGNRQMALYAVFGGLAFLMMSAFGGSRRDKALACLGLAVTGSAVIAVGTVVSGTLWVAAVVTVPVSFGIFFAGVAGPNAAGGVGGALLAYVVPVATPGSAWMIPDRLAGWWLAGAVATALIVLSPSSAGDRLHAAVADSAGALSGLLGALVAGEPTSKRQERARSAAQEVMDAFESAPYRPVGLATADQALSNVVQLLEWCTALVMDMLDELPGPVGDPGLMSVAIARLAQAAALLRGESGVPEHTGPDRLHDRPGTDPLGVGHDDGARDRSPGAVLVTARRAFHEQAIAVTARAVALDTMIAVRHADPETIAERRRCWYGAAQAAGTVGSMAGGTGGAAISAPGSACGIASGIASRGRAASVSGMLSSLARHASLRSVWMLNSLRGSVALAAAVLAADLSGVQNGFWVVLGTMSVLRSNAATTEATALRALAGTALGFAVGALLLLAIGTSQAALWAALVAGVALAAYAPGVLPFTLGQAAFTVMVVVLFNLLAPVGWTVGVVRVQDVALGCAVSLVVGLLFWPRGAGSIVGDDLADAYRHGSRYLTEAVDWALCRRDTPPQAGPAAVTAGIRLDEALRGYLAEQGSKRTSKNDLWHLVGAVTRLRLTAYSIASLRSEGGGPRPEHDELASATADLAGFYQRVSALVGPPVAGQVLEAGSPPPLCGLRDDGPHHDLLWIREHLHNLGAHVGIIAEPASRVAEQRRLPWWR